MHNPLRKFLPENLSLFRARLLLEEGQSEQALVVLEAIQTDDEKQQREKAYFLGWCYVLHHRWDEAMRVLLPFSRYEEEQGEPMERVSRERQARCLLHLGYAAINWS